MSTCDTSTGDVVYKDRTPGSKFGVWTGGYSCERVALLASVATAGYHSISRYQWYKSDEPLVGETCPLFYTEVCGTYMCQVTAGEEKKELVFTVEEGHQNCLQVTSPEHPEEIIINSGFAISKRLSQYFSQIDVEEPTKLVLKECIGQGTFGTVHKASWRGSLIAAKVIPTQKADTTSIQAEINFLRKVQHPNLSSFLGSVEVPGGVAILSPLVLGKNLHDHLFEDTRKVGCKLLVTLFVISSKLSVLSY